MVHVNKVIEALNKTRTGSNFSVTYETDKLIGIILKTTKFQLESIQSTYKPFRQLESRSKRELVNPFHGIGRAAEWAFGLTSHQHFNQVQNSIQQNIKLLKDDDQQLSEAVQENSKEIQESLQLLKQFDKFLKNVEKNDANLVNTDRLFLKLLRYKIDLDSSLDTLRRTVSMVTEVVDQSDLGLPSRLMFSDSFLRNSVLKVDEKFPGLSPIFDINNVDKYYSLTLALSRQSQESIKTLIKIPMTDAEGVFEESHHDFNQGLITLESSRHQVIVTYSQYKRCLQSMSRNTNERICLLRPCLLIKNVSHDVKCIAINETSYFVSSPHPDTLITSSCSGYNHVIEISNLTQLSVPPQCQINSKYFTIKPLLNVKTAPNLPHASSSSNLPDNLHLVHIFASKEETPNDKFPDHLHVLPIASTTLAILSVVMLIIITVFWVRKRRGTDSTVGVKVEEQSLPADCPPPYSEDIVAAVGHDDYAQARVEFGGVLELECEEEGGDCRDCDQSSSIITIIESNMINSLSLPYNSNLNIKQIPSSSSSKLFNFSVRLNFSHYCTK